MAKREFRLKRIWDKVVWTIRLALLGATPVSAAILAYQSIAIPMRNRMGSPLVGYSARIRKNGESCMLHFAGTYDELLVLTEVFVDEAYELPRFIERHGVLRIIDAGANTGYVSAYYSLMYPGVIIHAYEPSQIVLPILEKNIASLQNVTLYRQAIAAKDGTVEFHQDTRKNIASSVFDRNNGSRLVSVEAISLDTALSRIGEKTIVKMDIEGAEFDVIGSCTQKEKISYITGEAHGDIASRDNSDIVRSLEGTHSVRLSAVAHTKRAIFHAVRVGIPINVTYVLPSLIVGGIERQFVRQMNAIDKRIVSPSLITLFEYEGRENLYGNISDIQAVRLSGGGIYSSIRKVFAVRKALVDLQSDVVVSSMFSGNTCAAIACRMLGIPHIPREHNTYEEKGKVHHLADRWIANHSYRCVAVSKAVARFAADAIGIEHSRYAVIGNGVDIHEIEEESREKTRQDVRMRKGIGMDETIFLNVARLKKAKNQVALIEAFKRVERVMFDMRLLLAGDGNERETIDREIDSRDMTGKIFRLGHRDDVEALYMASDAFILPSLREGFPNVALEALSHGLPVIMTEGIGGQEELVTDGVQGFVCKSDPDSIEQAMLRWMQIGDQEKDAMKAAAYETAKKYSIDSIVGIYTRLFIDAAMRNDAGNDKGTIKS